MLYYYTVSGYTASSDPIILGTCTVTLATEKPRYKSYHMDRCLNYAIDITVRLTDDS